MREGGGHGKKHIGRAFLSFHIILFFPSLVSFFSCPNLVLPSCWPRSPPLYLAALCSTNRSQAGKDPVKLAQFERKKQDKAVETRGGAQLPAPGHSLWSTTPCLFCSRKNQRQKLQLMSGMALPFLPHCYFIASTYTILIVLSLSKICCYHCWRKKSGLDRPLVSSDKAIIMFLFTSH